MTLLIEDLQRGHQYSISTNTRRSYNAVLLFGPPRRDISDASMTIHVCSPDIL